LAEEATRILLVIDTNIIISLIQNDQLAILARLKGYRAVVPNEVINEVTNADQSKILSQALDDGILARDSVTGITELQLFSDYISRMGRGEAACLAIATSRGCKLASDEKRRFRRLAIEAIGEERIMTLEMLRNLAEE